MMIKLKEGVTSYSVTTARRVPFPLQKEVKAEFDRMTAAGIIREVTESTDWCAPMVQVVRQYGSIRICVDFERLNMAVKCPHCMLPSLDNIVPEMAGATVFSTLDASSRFFQVSSHLETMPLTTFIIAFGWYCLKRVPMGISLGPEVTVEGLDGCEAIMDSIVNDRTGT